MDRIVKIGKSPIGSLGLSIISFLVMFSAYEMTNNYLLEALLFGLVAVPAVLFLNAFVKEGLEDLLPLMVGLFIGQVLVYVTGV